MTKLQLGLLEKNTLEPDVIQVRKTFGVCWNSLEKVYLTSPWSPCIDIGQEISKTAYVPAKHPREQFERS